MSIMKPGKDRYELLYQNREESTELGRLKRPTQVYGVGCTRQFGGLGGEVREQRALESPKKVSFGPTNSLPSAGSARIFPLF